MWAKMGPLVEHEHYHVKEEEAHEDNLRHKLTINAHMSLEVTEINKKRTITIRSLSAGT
jgi:hypothetical protein